MGILTVIVLRPGGVVEMSAPGTPFSATRKRYSGREKTGRWSFSLTTRILITAVLLRRSEVKVSLATICKICQISFISWKEKWSTYGKLVARDAFKV
jgi:hypothetical protein